MPYPCFGAGAGDAPVEAVGGLLARKTFCVSPKLLHRTAEPVLDFQEPSCSLLLSSVANTVAKERINCL